MYTYVICIQKNCNLHSISQYFVFSVESTKLSSHILWNTNSTYELPSLNTSDTVPPSYLLASRLSSSWMKESSTLEVDDVKASKSLFTVDAHTEKGFFSRHSSAQTGNSVRGPQVVTSTISDSSQDDPSNSLSAESVNTDIVDNRSTHDSPLTHSTTSSSTLSTTLEPLKAQQDSYSDCKALTRTSSLTSITSIDMDDAPQLDWRVSARMQLLVLWANVLVGRPGSISLPLVPFMKSSFLDTLNFMLCLGHVSYFILKLWTSKEMCMLSVNQINSCY